MAREPGRLPCASESFSRGEPLIATASRVRRWLLVEQPGPWGRDALLESQLDDTTARTLHSRARRAGVRVVLIRRPRWHGPAPRRAYLVRSDPSGRWVEQFDLEDPGALTDIDLSWTERPDPPGEGRPGPDSLHLVCTNGRHDPCCADFGRPVVRAMSDESVAEVWESSHVGGDRFAANLVILPTGVYYGRVPPEDAAQMIRDHGNGLLDLDHYRGLSCYQPLVQAAEIFIRRELGERRLDALQLDSTAREADDTAIVVFRRDAARFEAKVQRVPGPPEHLTCSDHGMSRPWQHHLLALRHLTP